MVLDSQRLEAFHSSDGDETAASVEFHKSWGRVYLDKEEKHYVDGETYLIGVVVCQMDPQCEMEALKAQAVLGRTFLYKKNGSGWKGESERTGNFPGSAEPVGGNMGKGWICYRL